MSCEKPCFYRAIRDQDPSSIHCAGEDESFALLRSKHAEPALQTLRAAKGILDSHLQASKEACRAIEFHNARMVNGGQSYTEPFCGAKQFPGLNQDRNMSLASAAAPPLPTAGANGCPLAGIGKCIDYLFSANGTGEELAVMARTCTQKLHASIMIAASGRMALTGWVRAKKPPKRALIKDSEIVTMFSELDADGDGYINKVEFLRAFDRMGLPANTEYLRCALIPLPLYLLHHIHLLQR